MALDPGQREYIMQSISDLSKDAYGFRVRLDYAAMSDDELASTFDRYAAAAKAAAEDERNLMEAARATWEERIDDIIATGAGDRATAIRWDMDANQADGDIGYYCYLLGMSFAMEPKIQAILED